MPFVLPVAPKVVAPPDTIIRDGLISRWPLDDGTGSATARDDQSTNTGTLSGMDPQTAWVPGRQGGDTALEFGGSPEQVQVAHASELNPALVSVCLWIKLNTVPSAAWPGLFGKMNTSWNQGYGIFLRNNEIRFFYGSYIRYGMISDAVLRDLGWHLLIGTYDGSEKQLYLDDVAGTPNVGGETPQTTTESVTLGFMAGGDHQLQVQQDVRIYNRALSAGERTAIFNGTG